jgi:uncharacterized membrane protein YphA (DoxX/SURF4 family)
MQDTSGIAILLARPGVGLIKNLSIGGGLLAIYGAGPGTFSIDGRSNQLERASAQEITP